MRVITFAMIALAAGIATAGEKEEVASFRELHSKLKAALPEGWTLTTRWKTPYGSRVAHPTIVIQSKKKILVEQVYPSSAGLAPSDPQENPYLKWMILEIELETSPLMTPKDYAEMQKRNESYRQQRFAFGTKHLKDVPWLDVKRGEARPPQFLKPQSEEQRKKVLEFAFLWMRTEPVHLPTHYYKSFSVTRLDEQFIMFKNETDETRFGKISKAVEKILTAYPQPKK